MPAPLLATKLFIPSPRRSLVPRPRLIHRLDAGLAAGHRLTLVSAPAGFGKTTLVGEWVAGCGRPTAWLSLDEGDSDPGRFLAYLIAALQTVAPGAGAGALAMLGSPQPPPLEGPLTALLNDLVAIEGDVVLVLDDYHAVEAGPVDDALVFLVEHLPSRIHLVVATREDPALPLARLRARDQLTELRGADLRFTPDEIAAFLGQVMGLDLSGDEITALEARTEGWIAGLQLAAISLQGRDDVARFIATFAGSDRFVLDYLLEEVLARQPERVQTFLLRTSILERLCGPLCDAMLPDASTPGQATLEQLERANLFIVPLDNERRWYRYHHLFADLLRQRRRQSPALAGTEDGDHVRASAWLEANDFEIEAFEHAAAGHDVERAERLIEGRGMPLHFRGALVPILAWLGSLPDAVLDARPSLRVVHAAVLLGSGQVAGVEANLEAAERALAQAEPDGRARDLVGRIASVRGLLALSRHDVEAVLAESRRALEHLDPDNGPFRVSPLMTLGFAYQRQGDRAAARRAYLEVNAISAASGNVISELMGSIGLGLIQESDNELGPAAATFEHAVELAAGLPFPVVCEAHLGLARVQYQRNALDAALGQAERARELARLMPSTDRGAACGVVLARLALARGDAPGAAALLADAEEALRRHDSALAAPDVAGVRVQALLRAGDLAAAARLARAHDLPLSLARVHLAEGDGTTAIAVLEPFRRRMAEQAWPDQELLAVVLLALASDARGDLDGALALLGEALAIAEPGGFIRLFVDEGPPMARLLLEALARGASPDQVRRLLAAFPAIAPGSAASATTPADSRLAEPLSRRELEVLSLLADGLTNQEIASRLYLSLHTVKAHARTIYAKLGVGSRTQAAARARALGLLPTGGGPEGRP
ncbi:MAG TPA: LuxR C-terminal-related transcriptional regulator [Candidatus Limnocylindrales bacterium]|nr:LuxR C-terminal-related transcriptional regulator [Candidatus Limnocylindrales bacterium]